MSGTPHAIFTVTEAAAMLGTSTATARRMVDRHLKPLRTSAGWRMLTQADVVRLREVRDQRGGRNG